MAQFVVDHEKYMNPVPKELRNLAVLVEPLTIAEKALTQVWQVQQRLPWSCPVTLGTAAAHCQLTETGASLVKVPIHETGLMPPGRFVGTAYDFHVLL